MKNRKAIALVLVGLIAGLTLGTLGIAGAATSASSTTTRTPLARGLGRLFGGGGMFGGPGAAGQNASLPSVVASLTGMNVGDVVSQRQSGTSFADIAKAKGVSSDQVVDEAVKRASTLLRTRLETEMTETGQTRFGGSVGGRGMGGPGMRGRGMAGGAGVPSVVASLTGMNVADVASQRQAGKSFAEIAKSKGVTSDKVVAEAVERASTMLDAAVKAGRITSDRKAQILAEIKTHIETDVTATGETGFGPGMGGRGMGGRGMRGGGPGF